MRNRYYHVALWVVIVLMVLALFALFQSPYHQPASQEISLSQFLNDVDEDKIRNVVIQGQDIRGSYADGHRFHTYVPNDPSLFQRIYGKGVAITAARPVADDVSWPSILASWLPFVLMLALWGWVGRTITRALRTRDGRSLGQVVDECGSELKKLNDGLERLMNRRRQDASEQP